MYKVKEGHDLIDALWLHFSQVKRVQTGACDVSLQKIIKILKTKHPQATANGRPRKCLKTFAGL